MARFRTYNSAEKLEHVLGFNRESMELLLQINRTLLIWNMETLQECQVDRDAQDQRAAFTKLNG